MSIRIDHRRAISFSQNTKRRGGRLLREATKRVLIERLEGRTLLSAALDPSFGDNGMVETPSYNQFNLLSDNKILLLKTDTGSAAGDMVLYRYNNDGTLDTSYGSGGSLNLHPIFPWQSAMLSGGKI